MAKTKSSKPGPTPKYGEREEIHVLVPKAIQEKREHEQAVKQELGKITPPK